MPRLRTVQVSDGEDVRRFFDALADEYRDSHGDTRRRLRYRLRVIRRPLHGVGRSCLIEIGCGKGDFLALLCELGNNRCVGFDPSYEPDRLDTAAAQRLRIIPDLYTEAYTHLACDLLACRQTLEHISEPAVFLRGIRRALGSGRAALGARMPSAGLARKPRWRTSQ